MEEPASVQELFARGAAQLRELQQRPPASDEAKQLLRECVANLRTCSARVRQEGIFSANETMEDVKTAELRYFLVDYMLGQALLQTHGVAERLVALGSAARELEQFLERCDSYGVLSQEDARIFRDGEPSDAAERRNAKIASFRAEKTLRALVDQLSAKATDDDPFAQESFEDEERARSFALHSISLAATRAVRDFGRIQEERALLREMRAREASDAPKNVRDAPAPKSTRGMQAVTIGPQGDVTPLQIAPGRGGAVVLGKGGIARNLTAEEYAAITSSGASSSHMARATRSDLQRQVFRPYYSLPTQTVEEFGEDLARRMRIEEAERQAAAEAQQAGSGSDRSDDEDADADAQRRARAWDAWKDDHKRGEGNMGGGR